MNLFLLGLRIRAQEQITRRNCSLQSSARNSSFKIRNLYNAAVAAAAKIQQESESAKIYKNTWMRAATFLKRGDACECFNIYWQFPYKDMPAHLVASITAQALKLGIICDYCMDTCCLHPCESPRLIPQKTYVMASGTNSGSVSPAMQNQAKAPLTPITPPFVLDIPPKYTLKPISPISSSNF